MADDLSGWLRRVRPRVPADDGFADSAEGDAALSAIQHSATRTMTARRRNLRWALLPATAVAGAAAAVLVASSVSTPITEPSAQPPTVLPHIALRPAAHLLTPFSSCAALLDGLRQHAMAHPSSFVWYDYRYDGNVAAGRAFGTADAARGPAAPAAASAAGRTPSDTSTTNVQEAGVDEPDIVKTDGDLVVTVTGGKLRVVDASTHTITGTLDLTLYSGWQSAQLLASGDHAVVILSGTGGGRPIEVMPEGNLPNIAYPQSNTGRSSILYVDLTGTPKVTGTMQADGQVLDARMVGSTVRLVTSSRPTVQPIEFANDGKVTTKSRDALGKAPLSDWLPTYTVGNSTHAVPCTAVSHPADYTAASMVTIYTVDPARPGADPQPVSLAADGDTVYATQTSLYVASNPDCAWCFGAVARGGQTQIHRFDITGSGKPTYLGSGSVQGSLLSQYSMSDYANHLRVATTTSTSAGSHVTNGVTVLDDDTLKVTGAVGGLGAGERLYAVRFLGALGYVVTFNQIDPLYVLDLSDPDNPRAVGSLELNGFSSYLHDVGSGRLLGVGQDTTPVNEGGGVYAHLDGLLVQLFDVRNASKPTRTSHITLSNTPGQVQFDPHAFLYWAPTGLVAVPVGSWNSADNGKVLVARIQGSSLVQVGLVANAGDAPSNVIERSMIVDGDLWTLSPSGILVSNQATLAHDAWIGFG